MSVVSCFPGQQGVAAILAKPPKGRKVKSGPVGADEASRTGCRQCRFLIPVYMLVYRLYLVWSY